MDGMVMQPIVESELTDSDEPPPKEVRGNAPGGQKNDKDIKAKIEKPGKTQVKKTEPEKGEDLGKTKPSGSSSSSVGKKPAANVKPKAKPKQKAKATTKPKAKSKSVAKKRQRNPKMKRTLVRRKRNQEEVRVMECMECILSGPALLWHCCLFDCVFWSVEADEKETEKEKAIRVTNPHY